MGLLHLPQTYHHRPGITLEDLEFTCAEDLRTRRPSFTFELPVVSGLGKSRVMVVYGIEHVQGAGPVFSAVFGNGGLKGIDTRLVPLRGDFNFSDPSDPAYVMYYG